MLAPIGGHAARILLIQVPGLKNVRTTIGGLAPLLLALGTWCQAGAQPVCSISLGADATICQGSTVTLNGPSGYTNHLWSTGATTPSITVGTAGDYWCEVSYPSGNLVTNGNFSAGNTGFSSQFSYSLFSVQNEGVYTVGQNASWYHNQFQGTGNGNFLIGNAGWVSWVNGQQDVWCQTIPCCPGQTYTLSYRALTLSNEIPARALWVMDGVIAQWPDFTFPAYGAGWQQSTITWTAGPGQTSVNACIRITSADGVGDDFGLDDISMSSTVVLRDTVHVNVTPLPTVNLGPNQVLCAGDVLNLNAAVPGGSYVWQDGSTNPTFQVSTAGTYSVDVTAQSCTNSDQITVAYNPQPVINLGPDTTLCAGSSLTLSAPGAGYSHLWQDGSTAPSFTVTGPGTYWVEATLNNCSTRDTIQVAYLPMPTVDLGNDTAICAGASLLLDTTVPGATYLWQDGSTASSFTATAAGTYQVNVDLNGCTAQDAINVSVNPLPAVDLGPDVTLCPGDVAVFNATTAGATYLWNDGSSGATLAAAQPGTYSVAVTVNGCTARDTAVFSTFTLQSVNLGPDRSICAGESIQIGTTVAGASYLWNTGALSDTITVAGGGLYWMDAVLNGCTVRDSIVISVTPLPVFSLGTDPQVCPGQTAILDASTPGASYQWSTGASSPTIQAGPGTWSVAVTVNGCTAMDTAVVGLLTPPMVDLGPDTLLCPGESLVLDAAQPGGTYLWNTGATGPSITVGTPLTAWVQVTGGNGCTSADTVTVNYANPGSVQLGSDLALCAGNTVSLDATTAGAGQYLWSDGSTGAVLSTGTPGTYWVEVTVGSCIVGDTIQLTAAPAVAISLGNDTTLCPGETLVLQPVATGLTLQWQDGSQGTSFTVGQPGLYTVVSTNSAGCTDSASISVGYLDPAGLDPMADTVICQGTTVVLQAGLPGGTTVWSGAGTGSGGTLAVSAPGLYIATTSLAGCTFSDSVNVGITPVPVVDLGPDTVLCSGNSLLLSAPSGTVLWDDGSSATSRTLTQGGTYWVQVSTNGCSAADTITVAEVAPPTVDLGPDTSLCAGEVLWVDVTVGGGSYVWNDGNTAPQRALQNGGWHVTVTAGGCTATDSIQIGSLPSPILQLPMDTTLCTGATWTIDVTQPGCTYLWTDGSTAGTHVVTGPGTIGVTVSRGGCTATVQVQVSVVDLSGFTLGPDTVLCPGESLELLVDLPGATVQWQDGTTGPARTITTAGTYQATLEMDGCTAQSSIQVDYTPLPLLDLGPDQQLCEGDTALLTVDPGNGTLAWNTGDTIGTLTITATGMYAATLTVDGCATADTAWVRFNPVVREVNLGPDRLICPEQPITLDATLAGATSYQWSTGSTEPWITVDRPGSYTVEVSGPCVQAVDSVAVNEGPCIPVVHVPNSFTPDNDGINDRFAPVLHGTVRTWTFLIFNRWGQPIFQSDSPDSSWDGTFQGQDVPVGVYVWDLHYTTVAVGAVVQERSRGSVTLLR